MEFLFSSCKNSSACCWTRHPFPYSRADFLSCLRSYMRAATKIPLLRSWRPLRGVRFSRGRLVGLWIDVPTNVSVWAPYSEVRAWLDAVESWFAHRLRSAPAGLENGFVTGDLDLFDLRDAIATSLPLTVALSVLIAALVCLVTTLNLLLALFALLNVLGILAASVATIALLGWRLDMVEAVVITLAVGLAVDFCLHYGVAYRVHGAAQHRLTRAREALTSVGSPIAAAAATTALAGAGMLPTELLVYHQLALFLIVLMAWAWFFSTFVYVSFLAVIGPMGSCGRVFWSYTSCCSALTCTAAERVDMTVYSEVVASSITPPISGETPNDSAANDIIRPVLKSSFSSYGFAVSRQRPMTLEHCYGDSSKAKRNSASNVSDIWVKRATCKPRRATVALHSFDSLSNV